MWRFSRAPGALFVTPRFELSYLDNYAVSETWIAFCDHGRMIEVVSRNYDVACHNFIRVCGRQVGARRRVPAFQHIARPFEAVAVHELTLGVQAFDPGEPTAETGLQFIGREVWIGGDLPEQQKEPPSFSLFHLGSYDHAG